MNQSLRLTSLALGLGLLAGCGISGGFLRDSISSQRFDFKMDVAGVSYVQSVSGSATSGSVLCLFPISSTLYDTAMRNLYAAAQLEPNQVVMNLREDHTIRSFVFYCSHTVHISGDVFQLTPAAPGAPKVSSASLSQ
ncbi:hypothetical protein NR798_07585 [Archangium gephyra]|uniref:DUF6567 family protein n=1 Tax=Archangium gephyra TaxID=48 RepID=UPI0035D41C77